MKRERKTECYPMRLAAVTKSYLWGGERLYSRYNKGEPGRKTAESWELSGASEWIVTRMGRDK